MLKLTAVATAAWIVAGGLAFGATQQPSSAVSRADVASAVTSSCEVSQSGCLESVRTWIAAAAECRKQEGQDEGCVCLRESLDIARGLADAALFIKSRDVRLFGMVSSAITEGAYGCFAGAFAQSASGIVGSPG